MGKKAKGILKSLLASSRPFCDPFNLPKIFGEEGDDLIGLPVMGGADDNGICLEEWHSSTLSEALCLLTVEQPALASLTPLLRMES